MLEQRSYVTTCGAAWRAAGRARPQLAQLAPERNRSAITCEFRSTARTTNVEPVACFRRSHFADDLPTLYIRITILRRPRPEPLGLIDSSRALALRVASVTATASVVSVVTVPLFVNSALRLFASGQSVVQLPALTTPLALLAVSTLPVAAGMVLRRRRPAAARAVERRMGSVGLALLVFVAVVAFWSQRESLLPALARAGGPALLLNVLIVSLAWGIAAAVGLDRPQRIAVMLECALQNFALAAFVALTLLSDTSILMPPLAYALLCYLPGCLIVVFGRRAAAAEVRADPARGRPARSAASGGLPGHVIGERSLRRDRDRPARGRRAPGRRRPGA